MLSVCGYTFQSGASQARGSQTDRPSLCYSSLLYPQSRVTVQSPHRLSSLGVGLAPSTRAHLTGEDCSLGAGGNKAGVCLSCPAEVRVAWGHFLPSRCRSASLPSGAELENATLVMARREPRPPSPSAKGKRATRSQSSLFALHYVSLK